MTASLVPIYGRIYLLTNLVNGKQYVGQTIYSLRTRFRTHFNHAKHRNKGRSTPICRAMLKYTKSQFKIEQLCVCYNKDELDLMEDLYIAFFDTGSQKYTRA